MSWIDANQATIIAGFVTLVAGALVNAELNRLRDDRLRKEEKAALAAAVKSELVFIESSLRQNAEACRNLAKGEANGSIRVPNVAHMVKMYPHVLGQLYLLGREVVVVVNATYMLIETLGDTINQKSLYVVKGLGPCHVTKDYATDIAETFDGLADSMMQAINALSQITGERA